MKNAICTLFDDKFSHYAKVFLTSLETNYPTHPEILAFYQGTDTKMVDFLNSINRLKIMPCDFNIGRFDDLSPNYLNQSYN